MSKLTKLSPSLKVIADDVAAQKLRELLKDADDGFRRVVKVGLYIEWLAANLPHGQLMNWAAAHCPDVPERTMYRWRTMAKNLCEWSGLKFANLANLTVPAENLLTLPLEKLPPHLQKARAKMDEILDSARTPKQLFFDMGFKQGELDAAGYPKAKLGRLKGQGGATKEQRANAAQLEEAEQITEMKLKAEEFADWLQDVFEDGKIDKIFGTAILQRLDERMGYARGYIKHNGGAK